MTSCVRPIQCGENAWWVEGEEASSNLQSYWGQTLFSNSTGEGGVARRGGGYFPAEAAVVPQDPRRTLPMMTARLELDEGSRGGNKSGRAETWAAVSCEVRGQTATLEEVCGGGFRFL